MPHQNHGQQSAKTGRPPRRIIQGIPMPLEDTQPTPSRGQVVRARVNPPAGEWRYQPTCGERALPIIDPDHTEPIHLMNQRRRIG